MSFEKATFCKRSHKGCGNSDDTPSFPHEDLSPPYVGKTGRHSSHSVKKIHLSLSLHSLSLPTLHTRTHAHRLHSHLPSPPTRNLPSRSLIALALTACTHTPYTPSQRALILTTCTHTQHTLTCAHHLPSPLALT